MNLFSLGPTWRTTIFRKDLHHHQNFLFGFLNKVTFFAPGCLSLVLQYQQRSSTGRRLFSHQQRMSCQRQQQRESRSIASPSVLPSCRGHAGEIYFYRIFLVIIDHLYFRRAPASQTSVTLGGSSVGTTGTFDSTNTNTLLPSGNTLNTLPGNTLDPIIEGGTGPLLLPSRTPLLFQAITTTTTARTVASTSTETFFRPRFPTFFTDRSPRILISSSTASPPISTPNRIEVAASVADMMAGKEEKDTTSPRSTEVPVFHTTSAASLGNNTLELRGGSGPHEGNVYINGFPVCEDDESNVNQWRRAEANVVCRMFGYVGAAAAFPNCRL